MPVGVFVTGAGSGIGAELVRHYAGRGCLVGAFGRRPAPLEALARSLGGGRCVAYAGDVRDPRSVEAAARDFLSRCDGPLVVVGNAGISRGVDTHRSEDEGAFRAIFETNVLGLVNTFRPFVPAMQAAGRGTLAGIASVAGFRGLPGSSAYCASKAAAIAYLESLRVELAGDGVRVVTVCPGYVATPMTERNPYPMPFILEPAVAAKRIARAIDSGRRLAVVPWQMALVAALLRALPGPVFDRALARAQRKPRDAVI